MYKFFVKIDNNYMNFTNKGYSFHSRISQGRAFDSVTDAMEAYEYMRSRYPALAGKVVEIVAAGIDKNTIMVMTRITN